MRLYNQVNWAKYNCHYFIETRHSALRMVVEDVCVGEAYVRRLIFLSRPHLTQSEANLKTVKGKKGKGLKRVVDMSMLASTYHSIMIGSLGHYLSAPSRVLVVGLGGGSLPCYIHSKFPLSNVHVVEVNTIFILVNLY